MKRKIQAGTHVAPNEYKIKIVARGPYLVFGKPPLSQQFIILNAEGDSWEFREGEHYPLTASPTALCRCGASHRAPFCDGTHTKAEWSDSQPSNNTSLLDEAERTEGPRLTLTDNEKYCSFARFCDAAGRVWHNVERSDDQTSHDLAIRQASMCPSGRLMAWDNDSGRPFEPHYEPSLGLIEDPSMMASGGLWVRGGIPVEGADGKEYEVRNRVVLCRCGASANKPFCDGSHAAIHFDDGLPIDAYAKDEAEATV